LITYEQTKQMLASLKPADEKGRERFIKWNKEEESGVITNTSEPMNAQAALENVWMFLMASGMALGIPISNSSSENGLRFQYENPISGKCWIQVYRIGEDEFIVHGYQEKG